MFGAERAHDIALQIPASSAAHSGIMYWGCIHVGGQVALVRVDGIMKSGMDDAVRSAFNEICTPDYCAKLFSSFPKRIDQVTASSGFRINY